METIGAVTGAGNTPVFPAHTGPMSEAVRRFDWASTSLGPLATWPPGLRVAVDMLLASAFPQCLAWGPSLVTIYNDAFRPILGRKPEALGRPFNVVWAEVWDALAPVAELAFHGQATYIEDHPLVVDRMGVPEQTYFTFCYSPVRDEAGVVQGMLDTVIETTAKVAAQRQLLHHAESLARQVAERTADLTAANAQLVVARDMAESATRAKSAFLANMSHEIRTPLNGILGLAYLLRSHVQGAPQRDWLTKIEDSGQHLLRIVNDILDLTRIEAEKLSLEAADFDVRAVVAATVAMVERDAVSKGLQLVVDTHALPARARGDAGRLSQMLLNLLSNAVRFTDHGQVAVKGAVAATDAAGMLVRIVVTDTGEGIAADVQARLFRDFEQGDNSTTRRRGGTGLGLALTRKLAHAMGGEVGVDSDVGAGSTFWLTVRLQHAPADSSDAQADGRAARDATLDVLLQRLRREATGRRVLLAEDNVINQEVVVHLVRDAGIVVDVASNGDEAVSMANARPYDLILMDVQMPGRDGVAATRAILRSGAAAPPIVALTANAMAEERDLCLAAGMVDHLAKPIDPETLYAALLHWLPRAAAHEAATPVQN